MKNITIYTVIPFFSDGIEVNQNEVKSFVDKYEATIYSSHVGGHFELVESELCFDKKPVSLVDWLNKRIEKTSKELSEETDLNIKIGKGGKRTVYKEVLEFIKKH